MLRKLTPTVLALAIGAASLPAATIAERAEHITAIKALAELGLRLPAERAAAAYAKAGYPDEGQAKAALDFYLADVFKSTAPAPKDQEYAATYARLQPQIEKLQADASKLPPDVKNLLGGGGGNSTLLRLVNDVLRLMNPDQPPPLVPLTDEKVEQINRDVKGILDVAKKDYEAAKKKIAAHAKEEEDVWNLEENSPQAQKINQDSVELRMEGARPLYFAHLALREVVFRGDAFKSESGKKTVDAKAASEFLKTLLATDKEALEKWDYDFSDYHPQLKLYMATLFGEAAKLGVTGVTIEDAEGHFIGPGLIDRDLSLYKDAKTRDGVQKVVLKGWAQLLRWQLEQNSKRSIERGLDNWREFQNRAKTDKNLVLSSPDQERARTLGEIWILAGRLFSARGDAASATALWSEVIASKNPHAFDAKRWLTKSTTSSGGGDPWGEHPLAADPSSSLTGAKAFLAEAKNANPQQQRRFYLNAAVTLRNAVLGLTSSAFEDQFVDTAPSIYYFYSLSLAKLDMPYHAAIAAHDGLRAITARITDKTNPWKDGKTGDYTTNGQMVKNLAQNALAYVGLLRSFTKGSGTDRLYADISKMIDKVDPSGEIGGIGAKMAEIKDLYASEKFEEGIQVAREAVDKYKEHYFKLFGAITDGRLRWASKLRDSKDKADQDKLTKLIDDVTKSTESVEKKVNELIPNEKDPVKLKELENAKKTCSSARVSLLLNAKKYDDVLAQLGPEYWQKPPADRDVAASMLRNLAQAVYEGQAEVVKLNDPAKLLEAWPRYQAASTIFKKHSVKLEDGAGINLKNAANMLAAGLQKVSIAANQMQAKEPKLAAVSDDAKRDFAEIIGPRLDEKSKPILIRQIAETLWSLGDKPGAARLYEVYKRSLDVSQELQAYLADPATTVDSYAATLANRSEFKQPWADLRDLLVDKAGFLNDYRSAQSAEDVAKLGEKKRNFVLAADKVEGFKKLVTAQKNILSADQSKAMEEGIGKLGELVDMLAMNIKVSERLANFYLSSGQAAKAIPLGQWLYNDYDPRDPEYGKIYVEGVLKGLKEAAADINQKAIEDAREIAGRNAAAVRDNASQRDTFWMSYIQVFELSLAMKDTKRMEEALAYLQKNKSTPRDDLVLAPQPGDDPKVRRARDALAGELADRYLHVFDTLQNVKPTFRVDHLQADGKPVIVFVEVDAPPMQARVETVDGDERVVVVPAAAAPDGAAKPEGN